MLITVSAVHTALAAIRMGATALRIFVERDAAALTAIIFFSFAHIGAKVLQKLYVITAMKLL